MIENFLAFSIINKNYWKIISKSFLIIKKALNKMNKNKKKKKKKINNHIMEVKIINFKYMKNKILIKMKIFSVKNWKQIFNN
jgi:hypothetical protein